MKGIRNRQKKSVIPKHEFKKDTNKFEKSKKKIKKKDQPRRP